jgi:type I restriction enzyme, S subunit
MNKDWSLLKIKDYPVEIIDGDRGNNYPKKSDFLADGHCLFLNTGNVTTSGFNFNDVVFVSKDRHKLLRKGELQRGDSVLTTRGTIGNVAFYSNSVTYNCMRINSGMLVLRPKIEKLLPAFFYQIMKSAIFQDQAMLFRYGAAQPQLPIATLKHIQLPLPPLPTQQKIARILSAYDELIENNLQRIKLLEEMAQITYEEWFVRMRFPGHETTPIDAETGLPEGWAPRNLNEQITIKHGYAYKGEYFRDNKTTKILLTPGNFKIGGGLKLDKIKYYDEQAENPEGYVLKKNDLLVTMTDLSKMADTLGYPLLVPSDQKNLYLHNQRLGKVSPIKGCYFPKYFYYMLFQDQNYRGFVVGSSSGATVKHTSPSKILAFKPKLPLISNGLIKEFDNSVKPYFESVDYLLQQNKLLSEARDILLPRLMTGMIDADSLNLPETLKDTEAA